MLKKVLLAAACLLVSASLVNGPAAEVSVKFSGDVLYRWMLDWNSYKTKGTIDPATNKLVDGGEDSLTTGDFQNRYWWNLRVGVSVNENLAFNIRLSNPSGYFTDRVASNLSLVGLGGTPNFLSVPELYFKWNYSILTLMGGFIPVGAPGPGMYNSVLDLVAFETGKYANVGLMPWFVATNGSQAGLDLLLTFLKNDNASIGLEVMATVAADSGASETVDQIRKDQFRYLVSVPVSLLGKKLSLLPVLHLRTNVARSADLEDGNVSVAGGMDLILKPLEDPSKLQARLGYAVGGYSNSSQEDDSPYVATAPLGMVLNVGLKSSPGYGTATVDFAWGSWKDRELEVPVPGGTAGGPVKTDVVSSNLLYWDIMFDAPIKSLVLRPRLRLWYWTNTGNDFSRLLARPEIDFIAKF